MKGTPMIRMSGFDLETTGAKPETARIVQFGFAHVGGDQRPEVVECLVDPGVDVPEEAANIHGLTTEKVRAEGVNNVAAITQIVKQVTECVNNARPLVGHNISYDLTVLDRECRRHLGAPLETLVGAPVRPVVDTLVLSKRIDPYRRRVSDTQVPTSSGPVWSRWSPPSGPPSCGMRARLMVRCTTAVCRCM